MVLISTSAMLILASVISTESGMMLERQAGRLERERVRLFWITHAHGHPKNEDS
jgi:hypothetical protein